MTDATLDRGVDAEAGVAKHLEHTTIVAEHVGVKRVDPLFTRQRGESFEQPGADPVALQRVRHGEGHLSPARPLRVRIEASERDDPASHFDDERRSRPSL